jgi:hypothetical protein
VEKGNFDLSAYRLLAREYQIAHPAEVIFCRLPMLTSFRNFQAVCLDTEPALVGVMR